MKPKFDQTNFKQTIDCTHLKFHLSPKQHSTKYILFSYLALLAVNIIVTKSEVKHKLCVCVDVDVVDPL